MTSEDQKILFEKLGKQMNYTLGLPNFKLINDVIYKLCTKCKKYKPMTSKFFPRRADMDLIVKNVKRKKNLSV